MILKLGPNDRLDIKPLYIKKKKKKISILCFSALSIHSSLGGFFDRLELYWVMNLSEVILHFLHEVGEICNADTLSLLEIRIIKHSVFNPYFCILDASIFVDFYVRSSRQTRQDTIERW